VSFHDAVVVTNGKIEKLGSQLFIVLRQVAVHLQKVLSAPVILGRRVVETPQRLREARLARQNDLRTLVATSSDPVIVTNSNRRLVAANSQGLDLFGVSELNLSQFTMSTFLSNGQILEFDRNRPPSKRPEEMYAECKIRRLDGTSWVAECVFVANIAPHQNLYRFQHVTRQKTAQTGSPASYTKQARDPFGRAQPRITKAS
jgi:PAS domain-containing protein